MADQRENVIVKEFEKEWETVWEVFQERLDNPREPGTKAPTNLTTTHTSTYFTTHYSTSLITFTLISQAHPQIINYTNITTSNSTPKLFQITQTATSIYEPVTFPYHQKRRAP